MVEMDTFGTPRPVRVVFPVEVAFEAATFKLREFTANLSVGGIFLPTDHAVPPGTRGSLTFRISQWEDPFTVQAEVVRVHPPGQDEEVVEGLGIQFIDLTPLDRRRLERLVSGLRDGSVVEAIRRSIRETGRDLLQELRRRSADQKVMFALVANGLEIDALIRDGQPAAIQRLFDNPRLTEAHIKKLLRDPRVMLRALMALERNTRWKTWSRDVEVRTLFCMHPRSPLASALRMLQGLPRPNLEAIQQNNNVRPQVRNKAKQLAGGALAGAGPRAGW